MYALEANKFAFLVHLDHFSKFLKYFKYFEKQSKSTKNSDFFAYKAYTTLSSFWAKLGYSGIKIDLKIYHFIADSLQKDAVLTVGVNLRLCLLSLLFIHWFANNELKTYDLFF